MSPGQTGWLIWCLLWMLFWLTLGWIFFPINLMMAIVTGLFIIPCFMRGNR